jgi:hypothetical protein
MIPRKCTLVVLLKCKKANRVSIPPAYISGHTLLSVEKAGIIERPVSNPIASKDQFDPANIKNVRGTARSYGKEKLMPGDFCQDPHNKGLVGQASTILETVDL